MPGWLKGFGEVAEGGVGDAAGPGFGFELGQLGQDHTGVEIFGRGLGLVEALTDSRRVGPSDFGGTVVSFVMANAWPT